MARIFATPQTGQSSTRVSKAPSTQVDPDEYQVTLDAEYGLSLTGAHVFWEDMHNVIYCCECKRAAPLTTWTHVLTGEALAIDAVAARAAELAMQRPCPLKLEMPSWFRTKKRERSDSE